jgi:hypothetical protein
LSLSLLGVNDTETSGRMSIDAKRIQHHLVNPAGYKTEETPQKKINRICPFTESDLAGPENRQPF